MVAKSGPKLQPPKDTARSGVGLGRTGTADNGRAIGYWVQAWNASVAQIAEFMKGQMRRPVSDGTGIQGKWDFRFEFADESATGDAPAFLTALQDATGLKLNAAKGPVEFLVVDRAEKPTAN